MTAFAPPHMFGIAQTEDVMTLAYTLIGLGVYLLAVRVVLALFEGGRR